MRRFLLFTLTAVVAFVLSGAGAWAQQNASDEFTLEEITVTAEKRASNLQELPSSVVALPGDDLAIQGKITTSQILESIPNVTFRDGGGTNPNGNIAIRGIQRTQESGGTNDVLPATTAVYVDGVYQGIGGNYDTNRVEVLRGPQGTLYGRSATGGVVSFYTNDPQLEEFGGDISAEYGTASLINVQGAVNVPVGDKVALRAAAHYYMKDGYYEEEGGKTETKEGRIKALFQPTDTFDMVFSYSAQETKENGGGWTAYLDSPTEINYEGTYSEVRTGSPQKYNQASINANYDFGPSTLTYIGGYHDYDNTGLGAEAVRDGAGHADLTDWPTDWYMSHEVRLASDETEFLSWLVGANYFKHRFNTSLYSAQTSWPDDPELTYANDYLAPIWGRETDGSFENYGIFTEETFEVQDDFRITAGLRYDYTELIQDVFYRSNDNTSTLGNVMNPPEYVEASLMNDTHDYDNITYKLRLEYDLTQNNMIYFLTATGFMPGYTAISPNPFPTVTFQLLTFDEQKLTSYEVGSKNQFLNNTLRLNGAVFYYDYEGYPEAVNLRVPPGPPVFTVIPVPLEIIGVEVEAEYLISMYDKVSLNAGYLRAEITDYPGTITWSDGTTTPGEDAAVLETLPGTPEFTASVDYDHTFMLANGSTLVPRLELTYTGSYYLAQITQPMVELGEKPYMHQSSYTLANIGTTWTSPSNMYSVTGYVRNAFDEEYKASVTPSNSDITTINVTAGDPRTYGVMLNVKF